MTDPTAKDYRIVLYGLFSCVHYGWDICAGRRWNRLSFLLFRAVSHVVLFLLIQCDVRPHALEAGTGVFLLMGAWEKIQEMPTIWDSDAWCIQMDSAMGFWLIAQAYFGSKGRRSVIHVQQGKREKAIDDVIFYTIRDMFANYYFAAAFWKVNSDFLDPDASCATMFLVQMVVNYLRPLLIRSTWVLTPLKMSPDEALISIAFTAKTIAPLSALIVELSVGGLMVLGSMSHRRYSHRFQALGCVLALMFHLMVCFVPAPNDISGFALNCAPRHIVFATAGGTCKAYDLARKHALLLSTALTVGVGIGIRREWTENNWAFFLYACVGGFVALSVVSGNLPDQGQSVEVVKSLRRPLWSWAAVLFAFLYSFGTIMLGLQEESTANMFANLKSGHGGSNHYFLPTGLLFHWYADAPNSHPFGGGVVRIENTTSSWMQTIYPADFTQLLEPAGLIDVMEAIGSPAPIYFNPGANRNLGLLRDVPDRFFRYTVPALELKRLLHEAVERDADFELTYSKLRGTRGDEKWRATSIEEVVSIEVREGVVKECHVQHIDNGMGQWIPCKSDDLPYVSYIDSVPWIIRRISLYHAYPIVVDADDDDTKIPRSIRCFGP